MIRSRCGTGGPRDPSGACISPASLASGRRATGPRWSRRGGRPQRRPGGRRRPERSCCTAGWRQEGLGTCRRRADAMAAGDAMTGLAALAHRTFGGDAQQGSADYAGGRPDRRARRELDDRLVRLEGFGLGTIIVRALVISSRSSAPSLLWTPSLLGSGAWAGLIFATRRVGFDDTIGLCPSTAQGAAKQPDW